MTFYYIDNLTFSSLKNGLFAVNKLKGITSAQTLEIIKKNIADGIMKEDPLHSNALRAGHGGTLDSSATGVLVVGLLDGCKLLTKFLHGTKQYNVTGKLGTATDTYNELGSEIFSAQYSHVSENILKQALNKFKGRIKQVPPKYSALKKSGVRLSDLVRRGVDVDVSERIVVCHRLKLLEFSPPYFHLSITCGSGFYIRSLVHDLGLAVGSCAHVTELTRTKQGPFYIENCLKEDLWTRQNIIEAVGRHRPIVESYFKHLSLKKSDNVIKFANNS